MRIKISELMDTISTKDEMEQYITDLKTKVREIAYDKRKVIYKRDIEEEIARLDSIQPMCEILKNLKKESEDYEMIISINKEGYIWIDFTFPITKEFYEEVAEKKKKRVAELGAYGSLCVDFQEMLWEELHTDMENRFKQIMFSESVKAYPNYCGNPYKRITGIYMVRKCI
jgi:hypothetical protein